MDLFIFTRKGCCICENLKKNLFALNIDITYPKLKIFEIDIDRYDLYKNDYAKKVDWYFFYMEYQKSYQVQF